MTSTYSARQRRQWHPTPVLLPGKSHGRRSLVGCSPWGRKELDMTEQLQFRFSLSYIGEGNGSPLQCSCLENPRDGGAWWAAVYGVAQSRTRLKRLSSSSSSSEICIHPQQQKRWTKVKAATIYLMEMKGQSDREYASTTFYFLALVSLFYLVFRLTFHAGI